MGEPIKQKASEVVAMLDLKAHQEGGFYSEIFRDTSLLLPKSLLPPPCKPYIIRSDCCKGLQIPTKLSDNFSMDKVDRAVSTAIYFLLSSGSISHLHRIPCAEVFHFYAGEPVTVFELRDDGSFKLTVLGLDLEGGQRPQHVVPPYTWFGAFPTGDVKSYHENGSSLVLAPARDPEHHFSLLGTTCAPAFQFEDFELATAPDLISRVPHLEGFIRYLTRSGTQS